MAHNVRFVPDGSNPTRAIRKGYYERPPAFGGKLAPGEADAEARSAPCPLRLWVVTCFAYWCQKVQCKYAVHVAFLSA